MAVNYVASGGAAAQVVGKTIRSAGGEALCEVLRLGVLAGRSRAAGKIICNFSVHEKTQWARHANYGASKGGVSILMASMAQELGAQRIRINGIAPGVIKTGINRAALDTPQGEASLLQLIPYGRVGDVAKAAVWLASDESDYVTDATLYVEGGMPLYPAFRSNG